MNRGDLGVASQRSPVRFHCFALLALLLASILVRAYAARHRVSAGHGDVAAYYHVSKNLYAGRGFVQDFVADFLEEPQSVPTPSNTWWLPLPSIIAWIGMEIRGEDSYVAAKAAMIAVASLVSWVVYFTALLLLRDRTAALAAGILAVGFHLYLDQPTATLSHGPYSVFAGAAVLSLLAYRRWPRLLPFFGLFFGLTYLCRGDSQVLLAELALVAAGMRFLAREPVAIPWRSLAVCAALFVTVAAPWWIRNERVLGEIMPSGQKKVTWARSYEDWFTDTSRLTPEHYLKWGWENILDQKVKGVADAVDYVPDVMWRSVVRAGKERETVERDPDNPKRRILTLGTRVMTPLLWTGALALLVMRPWSSLLVYVHLLALALVYGVVFPAVGRESFRSSMFSVMPFALTAVITPIWLLLRALPRLAPGVRDVSLVAASAVLCVLNIAAAEPHLEDKARGVERTLAPYRQFGRWWRDGDRPDAVFFVRNPWQFTAETGLRCVMMPNVDADTMLEFARRFGVQFFLDEGTQGMELDVMRPGAAHLVRRGDAIEVQNPSPFRLYRISQRAMKRGASDGKPP